MDLGRMMSLEMVWTIQVALKNASKDFGHHCPPPLCFYPSWISQPWQPISPNQIADKLTSQGLVYHSSPRRWESLFRTDSRITTVVKCRRILLVPINGECGWIRESATTGAYTESECAWNPRWETMDPGQSVRMFMSKWTYFMFFLSELRDDIRVKWSPEAVADAVKPYVMGHGINTVSIIPMSTGETFLFSSILSDPDIRWAGYILASQPHLNPTRNHSPPAPIALPNPEIIHPNFPPRVRKISRPHRTCFGKVWPSSPKTLAKLVRLRLFARSVWTSEGANTSFYIGLRWLSAGVKKYVSASESVGLV